MRTLRSTVMSTLTCVPTGVTELIEPTFTPSTSTLDPA
jgi:hypothetical protein